jgi:DNA-binding GntR family transcriptional regulator
MTSRKVADRLPLADAVYKILLHQFMDGTRVPGESLNIAELSRELNVSQTPIREALARLEHTGLVSREALKGYRVAPLFSESDLAALTDARLVLEPALAEAATAHVNPAFLRTLLKTIDTLDQASDTADDSRTFPAYWSADERFHVTIAEQSGNPFLATSYRALGGQVQRFRLFAELGSSDAGHAAVEHRMIYEALKERDPELAAERMREHVRNAGTRAMKDRRNVTALRPHGRSRA